MLKNKKITAYVCICICMGVLKGAPPMPTFGNKKFILKLYKNIILSSHETLWRAHDWTYAHMYVCYKFPN